LEAVTETNSIQPTKPSGRKSSLDEAKIEELRSVVKRQPDLTLEELIDVMELPIKKSRLAVILDGRGLSFKKRRYTQKSNYAKIFKKNAPSGLKN
jgi:transposase